MRNGSKTGLPRREKRKDQLISRPRPRLAQLVLEFQLSKLRMKPILVSGTPFDDLQDEPWFQYEISRDTAKALLERAGFIEGMFVVRKSRCVNLVLFHSRSWLAARRANWH